MNTKAILELDAENPDALARYLVGNSIEDVEKALIQATLKKCLGRKTLAANVLGITPRTLNNKLQKYETAS